MNNIPLWQEIETKKYPSLKEDIETDILIIGGGITGISIFYELRNDPRKIVLVDKSDLGHGTTSRSTAKLTFLQQDIYTKLTNNFNYEIAKLYYESQKDAIKRIIDIINNEHISCDLEKNNSYLYAKNKKETEIIEKEKSILESFGAKTYPVKTLPNQKSCKYAFYTTDTYVFHPLKYVNNLSLKSLTKNHYIYENTCVIDITNKKNKYFCQTKDGIIKAKKVVLATHYPNFLFPYLFPLKCFLEKSSIIAKKSHHENKFNAINIKNPITSIRNYQDYMLYAGSTKNLCFYQNPTKDLKNLKNKSNIKNPDYYWTNHDIMTIDFLPYIGKIKPNLFLATGFNTWGMTNGILSGLILKDLLQDKPNKYQYLFDPKRGLSKEKLIRYPVNIFSNTYSFLTTKISQDKKWYKKNPQILNLNGKKVAIYEENNKKYMVYTTCPHLGCSLIFNKIEKTWDCPCHGSRFDKTGKSILGPSNYDITYKKD